MKKKISITTISPATYYNNESGKEMELEEALDKAGMGRFQVLHYLLMSYSLASSLMEMNSNAVIIPVAACDLMVPGNLRGLLLSVHNIGTVITGPLWGQAIDSRGRKSTLILSSAAGGCLCLLAAFMPNLLSFTLCKLIGSLFLACPGSVGYAYTSEFVPQKKRDTTVLICNALVLLLGALIPGTAWAILSFHWEYDLGYIVLRPWRLLTIAYALPLVIVATLTALTHESPKFLMSKGQNEKALKILRRVYAINSGLREDTYPVSYIKHMQEENCEIQEKNGSENSLVSSSKGTMLALLRPPHVKWLALICALMFGNSLLLPGLHGFSPDVMNKAMLHVNTESNKTVCQLIDFNQNMTQSENCTDSVSPSAFLILIACSLVYGGLCILISICPISKKIILILAYVIVGLACLISGLVPNQLVGSVAMSAILMAGLSLGPLSAFIVQLFPTNLRGKALSVMAVFGRLGSIAGAAAAGFFLLLNCSATFWGFAILTLCCAASATLLPSDKATKTTSKEDQLEE